MFKNVGSQRWVVFAFEDGGGTTPGAPKTGDAANITAKIDKDGAGAAATNDVNPTELEDGYYAFDLLQAESNADELLLMPESATANIQVIGVPGVIYTLPENFSSLMTEVTLARKMLQNRKEFDLTNSKMYLWNDAGDAREYEADLTDKDGAAVTQTTQGPINCSRLAVV